MNNNDKIFDEFDEKKNRNFLFVIYTLFSSGFATMGFLFPLTLASIIIIYLKRNSIQNNNLYSLHFDWLLRTFWIALPGYIFSIITMYFYVGYIIMSIVMMLSIYRIVRGWLSLLDNDVSYIDSSI